MIILPVSSLLFSRFVTSYARTLLDCVTTVHFLQILAIIVTQIPQKEHYKIEEFSMVYQANSVCSFLWRYPSSFPTYFLLSPFFLGIIHKHNTHTPEGTHTKGYWLFTFLFPWFLQCKLNFLFFTSFTFYLHFFNSELFSPDCFVILLES